MSNETKRDVFEDTVFNIETASPDGPEFARELRQRYSAALPDDMPVIPKAIGEYITSCKARMMDLHDSMFNWLRSEEEDEFMECYSEIFARAWLDGYQVEEAD